MKILRVIFLTGAVCTAAVRSPADLANAIQAIVHDTVVTRTDVETRILDVRQELFRQYRNQPAVFEVKLAEAMNEALEQQIETQLILHEFSAAGYSIPESIIEDEVRASSAIGSAIALRSPKVCTNVARISKNSADAFAKNSSSRKCA